MKVKEPTQSVRISKKKVKSIKIHVATHGGTIRSILEKGADYAMGEDICQLKKKK